MSRQIFTISLMQKENEKLTTKKLGELLENAVFDKVDQYIGFKIKRCGGSTEINVVQLKLIIENEETLSEKTMRNYLANNSESLKIMEIIRCPNYPEPFSFYF